MLQNPRYVRAMALGGHSVPAYAYALNNPVNFIDPNGLLVKATYNRSTGTVVVTDLDTGKTVTMPAKSGRPGLGDSSRGGPIPLGTYDILDHRKRPDFFRLDARDLLPRNDIHDPSGRDNFRLHKPGGTIGCISASDADKWREIRELIEGTSTETVTDRSVPWWKVWDRDITRFGSLEVIEVP
jgi:hypothetical protein